MPRAVVAAQIDGKLTVCGGSRNDKCWQFTKGADHWEELASMDRAREYSAGARVDGNALWIAAGVANSYAAYDPSKSTKPTDTSIILKVRVLVRTTRARGNAFLGVSQMPKQYIPKRSLKIIKSVRNKYSPEHTAPKMCFIGVGQKLILLERFFKSQHIVAITYLCSCSCALHFSNKPFSVRPHGGEVESRLR